MRLRNILNELKIYDVELINEQEFDTLGLAITNIDKDICTFIDNEKYIDSLTDSVSMIITNKDISKKIKNRGICITNNPRILFFEIHNFLKNNSEYVRIKFDTIIGNNCSISDKSFIAKNNVIIGNNVTIEEFVSIKENTSIGDNSIIRAGSIIGGEGFEFKNLGESIIGVQHLGGVILGNNVEIQYNSCVDKAVYPWDDTIIGDYVKVDNLVHIAHSVKVNKNVMIVALSGVGGRTIIDSNTWIGFSTTLKNGIYVGKNARVNMGAVVTTNVSEDQAVTGNFAIEHSKFLKHLKSIR